MKKRVLKKSEVLREGYEQGLREGLSVINQMIAEANGEQIDEGFFNQMKAGAKAAWDRFNGNGDYNTSINKSIKDEKKKRTDAEKRQKEALNGNKVKPNQRIDVDKWNKNVDDQEAAQKDIDVANNRISSYKKLKTNRFSGVMDAFSSGKKAQKEEDDRQDARNAEARNLKQTRLQAQKFMNKYNELPDAVKKIVKQRIAK